MSSDALADFQHFLVNDRLIENPRGHVGHYGDGEHLHSAMPCNHNFCDR